MENRKVAGKGKSRKAASSENKDPWQTVIRGKRSSPKGSPCASPMGTPLDTPPGTPPRDQARSLAAHSSTGKAVSAARGPGQMMVSSDEDLLSRPIPQDSLCFSSSTSGHHGVTVNKDLKNNQLSESFLQAVASDIPQKAWKWVFRTLMNDDKSTEVHIESIENNQENDLKEQKFQALLKWHHSKGNKATIADLDHALRDNYCSNVADEHTRPVLKSSGIQVGSKEFDGKSQRRQEEKPSRKINIVMNVHGQQDSIKISVEEDNVTITLPEKARRGPITDEKSRLAVALLDSVINPLQSKKHYKMKVNDVADRFNEKYGNQFKFKQLGVGRLIQFVKQSEWFKLSTDEMYVEQDQPLLRHRPLLDSGDQFPATTEVLSSSESDSELEGYNTCASTTNTPCPSPSFKLLQNDQTPWKPSPHRKRGRTLFKPTISNDRNICNFESIDVERFETLIKKPQSKSLKFTPEHHYTDKAFFSRDIVGMWNTPTRQTSYILIGIEANSSPPHDMIGLQESSKIDAFYQNQFLSNSFSYKPPYKYSEVTLCEQIYGVIVIPSSQGYDEGPCYADANDPSGQWHQNDLCYYGHAEYIVCKRKDTEKIIKWFTNQSHNQPESVSKDAFFEESQQAWDMFEAQLGEFSSRIAYSLVLSRCSTETKYLSALGNFQWAKVWDFDPESQDSGVLNICEPVIQDRLTVATWNDAPEDSLSNAFTEWVFVRGLMKRDDSMVPTQKVREWSAKVKVPLNAHCRQLMKYCETKPLRVVVLWYDNLDYILHLQRLLMKIDEYVCETKFILCMPKLPGSDDHRSNVHSLCEQLGIEKVVEISLERLCFGMASSCGPHQPSRSAKYQLPVAEGSGNSDINDRDAVWLHQEVDVLYKDVIKDQEISHTEMGKQFFRGGLLEWSEANLSIFDGKRSLYEEFMHQLNGYIDKGTSTIVTIYHEPGAGGTTFSRRVLWELHSRTPCVCVTATTLRVGEVCDRVEFLYQKTYLPVVVLIDGKETCLVEELFQRCQGCHILIVCVQRYTREIRKQLHRGNQHWLTGKVDYNEAARLSHVFSNNCDKSKQRQLNNIAEEVREGQPHFVYEFGLTVHAEEYRGIISYVKGYLNLTSGNLQPWQLAIGFLALATYYGHSSLPCQFFTSVFNIKQSELVTMNVLTHNGKQFVLEDSRKISWKITHHIVAKEILEQLLSARRLDEVRRHHESSNNRLSVDARKGLAAFAIRFISYVSEQVHTKKAYDPTSAVMTIVRTIFIHRDYKETGHDDVLSRRKQRLSRMISDVYEESSDSKSCNDNEKLNLLQHLAKNFPEDPLFSAHLGRALGIFNHHYEEAIVHLDKACSLRNAQRQSQKLIYQTHDNTGEDTDSTLSTIYHIYGFIYHRKIIDLIGGGELLKSRYTFSRKHDDLQLVLRKVIALAKVAVGYFRKCRHYCSKGMDKSYGYIGEIKLHLHFADFLETNYTGGFYGFLASPEEDIDVQKFAKSCFQEVDMLLQQYQNNMSTSDNDELDHCLNWYLVLFQDATTALQYWNDRDDVEGRRSKIAVLKIKHQMKGGRGKQNYATILNSFQSTEDIQEVVKLYEKNIDEVYSASLSKDVSLDLRNWIFAIRHRLQPKIYHMEKEVLRRIQQCYDTSSQSYTTLYYLYVLNTVLALGPNKLTKHVAESNRLFEKMKKIRGSMPKLQRLWAYEWVGSDKQRGIHRLIHRSSLGIWDSELRFWKDSSVSKKLEIFRGTIVHCTNSMHGLIMISTGNATGRHTLQAVFVPKASNLYGKMYKNKEVEFFIGFNIEHGIGAYNVRELKRVICDFCNSSVIVSALGMPQTCKKCNRVVSNQA